jgi:iron complex outermembrane recepter protein
MVGIADTMPGKETLRSTMAGPGMQRHYIRGAWLATFAMCAAAFTRQTHAADQDLATLSLEQLMNEPVTSVSKRETKLSESPAAISVVTQDDIRRMGITTLAEALRLVPGMDVARVSANEWAVSARGFNSQFAGKLLVLIDGRTVYTPASAGVFWNAQDVMIEDIDRIEVIRGPGATLWGANAVNGVINIITKRAQDTQGALVAATGGTEDKPGLAARYGGQAGPDLSYRVYAKYFDRDGFLDSTGAIDTGAWHTLRGGFRTDWSSSAADSVTVQGDAYSGEAGKPVDVVSLTPPSVTPINAVVQNSGANMLGRWTRAFSPDSALTLQGYFDHVIQGDGNGSEHRNTYDIDLQDRFGWGSRNDILWGAGYRLSAIDATQSFNLTWTPPNRDIRLFNLFMQDEIAVIQNRLHLTLGSKFEHDNIDGWNVEPNVRVAWTPAERQTVWGAISRAIRTPALFELDGRLNAAAFQPGPASPPVLVSILPNPELESEKLLAYELGYRFAPSNLVSVDISSFINRYSAVIVRNAGAPQFELNPGQAHILLPILEANSPNADTHGVEVSAQWQALQQWMLTASYTWSRMDVPQSPLTALGSPEQQFQVRSYLDLPLHLELNAALYYVDAVTEPSGPVSARIPAYIRGDVGLIWKPDGMLSLGLWGQNLLSPRHLEFASQNSSLLTEVPRSFLGKVTWSF